MTDFNKLRGLQILSCYKEGDSIIKGGEGSRGGHIIGHTKSGEPIYASGEKVKAHEDLMSVRGKLKHYSSYHINPNDVNNAFVNLHKSDKEALKKHFFRTRLGGEGWNI